MLLRSTLPLAILALLAACGSGQGGGQPASGGAAGAGGSGASAGQGAAAGQGSCATDRRSASPGASCIESVTGRVVDAAGSGLGELPVSVCGATCFYGASDATGAFEVLVGEQVVAAKYSVLPHGRPNRTSFYFALPGDSFGVAAMGDLLVLDFPPSGPALVVRGDGQGAPAQSVTSNGVTLSVDAGTQIKLDVEDLTLGDTGKQFRVLPIPAEQRDRFADPTLGLSALWALTPFEAEAVSEASGGPASVRLSLPNPEGWAAGAAVELFALGSYLFPEWVEPATFQLVATGRVSADTTRIEMDAGQGIRHLTWIAARPSP